MMERQVKWSFDEEIKFGKRIDVECGDNFTVVTKKSRLKRNGGRKKKGASQAPNSAVFELPR
jgi:hypothetical protein